MRRAAEWTGIQQRASCPIKGSKKRVAEKMLCGSIETPEAHVSSFDQLEPVAFSGSRTGRSLGQSGVFSIFFPLKQPRKRKNVRNTTRAPDNCRAPTMSNYDAILAEAESNRAAAGDLERRYARCPRSAPDDPRRACSCARDADIFWKNELPRIWRSRGNHTFAASLTGASRARTRIARRTLTSPTLHSANVAMMRTTAAGSLLSPRTTR